MPPYVPARLVLGRRSLIGAACVGCATALTACGGDDEPATAAAEPSVAAGTAAPSTAASGASAPIAQLADLTVGESKAVKVDGKAVLMTRTGPDTVVAFSARCTHMGCTVEPSGAELACPCHGSKYKASDGSVINGPAPAPLAAVAVKVVAGAVVAG